LSILFVFFAFKFRKKIESNQRTFYKSIIQCEISERERIAKEIHDGIGGLLGMAKFHLSNFDVNEKLTDVQKSELIKSIELIDLANEEARNISNELLPASIIRYGLKGAVEDLIKIYSPQFGIEMYFDCQNEIPKSLQANIYRISTVPL
jgi:signal transduction histidine kinase